MRKQEEVLRGLVDWYMKTIGLSYRDALNDRGIGLKFDRLISSLVNSFGVRDENEKAVDVVLKDTTTADHLLFLFTDVIAVMSEYSYIGWKMDGRNSQACLECRNVVEYLKGDMNIVTSNEAVRAYLQQVHRTLQQSLTGVALWGFYEWGRLVCQGPRKKELAPIFKKLYKYLCSDASTDCSMSEVFDGLKQRSYFQLV